VNFEELAEAAFKAEATVLASIKKRNLVWWDEKLDGFLLNEGDGSTYGPVLPADERTHSELVDWIFHLRDKVWFTAQHLDDLLQLIPKHIGHPRNWGKK